MTFQNAAGQAWIGRSSFVERLKLPAGGKICFRSTTILNHMGLGIARVILQNVLAIYITRGLYCVPMNNSKPLTRSFFAGCGSVGGRSKSPAKVAAARKNAAKAAAARRKKAVKP